MSIDIMDLEPGDLTWFALRAEDTANMATVEDITDGQIALRWEGGLLVGDVASFHLLEKWWGHGPLGDGTGMGPDGFDVDLCSEEDLEEFPWLKKSNEIKDLEKEK